MLGVKGKWTFITGAARGLGYLAAKFMAEQGSNLILQGRSKEHCEKIAEEVRALGVEVHTVAAEFTDIGQVEAMLKEIDELGVEVDIVLNNAGLQVTYRTEYLETPAKDYETSFLINTIAPMMIVYHFLPKMQKRGFGRIVNTTSGIRLEPEQAGYSASKAALDKVTMDLASKYDGTDVILSLTDPGWCRTDLGGDQAPNSPESAIPGIIIGAFVDDKKSGRCFVAPEFHDMDLQQAYEYATNKVEKYTGNIG